MLLLQLPQRGRPGLRWCWCGCGCEWHGEAGGVTHAAARCGVVILPHRSVRLWLCPMEAAAVRRGMKGDAWPPVKEPRTCVWLVRERAGWSTSGRRLGW